MKNKMNEINFTAAPIDKQLQVCIVLHVHWPPLFGVIESQPVVQHSATAHAPGRLCGRPSLCLYQLARNHGNGKMRAVVVMGKIQIMDLDVLGGKY
jgi:hypothetical protein